MAIMDPITVYAVTPFSPITIEDITKMAMYLTSKTAPVSTVFVLVSQYHIGPVHPLAKNITIHFASQRDSHS